MSGSKKLFNKNFNILVSGQMVSTLGNSLYQIALILFLKELFNSGSIIGIVEMSALLPIVFLGPFAGAIVDNWDRKKIIVLGDIVRGILIIFLSCFLLGIIPLPGGDTVHVKVGIIIAVTLVVGVLTSIFNPAIPSTLPTIVPREQLKRANSFNMIGKNLSDMGGKALVGILYPLLGGIVLFFVNGISFIISGISELFITIPKHTRIKPTKHKNKLKQFFQDTSDGIKYILKAKGIRDITLIAMFNNISIPAIIVGMPFYLEDVLNVSSSYFGYVFSLFLLGGVVGYVLVGNIKMSGKGEYKIFAAQFSVLVVVTIILALTKNLFILFGVAFIMGFSMGLLNLILETKLQIVVPPDMRGRVYGATDSVTQGLTPISYGVTGFIIDAVNKEIDKVFLGVAGIFLICLILVLFSKPIYRLIKDEIDSYSEKNGKVGEV